ncbi:hypothetical protein JT359_15645 [Candidatus Poribacteria bacterium]|nr:hypothetical protein [Candidatus Poribacteria bacterium]
MNKQTPEFYEKINPLLSLSSRTLRLYSALDIFRVKSNSIEKPDWFRTPNRDEILGKVGFSKADIDSGITELIDANLLQVQNKNHDQWYCLK